MSREVLMYSMYVRTYVSHIGCSKRCICMGWWQEKRYPHLFEIVNWKFLYVVFLHERV